MQKRINYYRLPFLLKFGDKFLHQVYQDFYFADLTTNHTDMPPLFLPEWIKNHLFPHKKFEQLTSGEINEIKKRLKNFQHENPEVTVVIPAWNEGNNIYRTLSSLASNVTSLKAEIIVINNNSTDSTQEVLDELEVRNFFQPEQGISFARQLGLEKARGRFLLCADADSFYPPYWIEHMVRPMKENNEITGVYGRYSFLPPKGKGRFGLYFYELLTGVLIRIRKKNREYENVLGFNMGLITEVGRVTGGFKVNKARRFNNEKGSALYSDESEDGRMAQRLKTQGSLKLISTPEARVFTITRNLMKDGNIFMAFWKRLLTHTRHMGLYVLGIKSKALIAEEKNF